MCGRFVSSNPPDQIARYFDAAPPETLLPASWNIAPTNDIYAVVEHADGTRHVEVFHWGLVPIWAKDIKIGSKMINARSEGLATKSAYKAAFKRKRCLVPMDGFYEWKATPGLVGPKGKPAKQPMFIHRLDGEPLAVAGLWETWRDPSNPDGGRLHSCTVITTSANATMAPVHDRMPVILAPQAWEEWLNPANDDLESLGRLLVPAPPKLLTMYPVSTAVNHVREKGPELIEPIDPSEEGSGALF
jgi:putative SOS response-associated peptidase YedK